jgi:hypothetical protein
MVIQNETTSQDAAIMQDTVFAHGRYKFSSAKFFCGMPSYPLGAEISGGYHMFTWRWSG